MRYAVLIDVDGDIMVFVTTQSLRYLIALKMR